MDNSAPIDPDVDLPEPEDADYLDIPELDPVSIRTLKLLGQEDFSMRQFAEVVDADPRITGQLLQLAGSPLYGASQKFDSSQKAIVFLGLRTALSISLGISLFQCMKRGVSSLDETWCRRRILFNAVAGRELARLTRRSTPEQAFLTAMIQDFGLLLLIQQRPREYRKLLDRYRQSPVPFALLESETLGYNHGIVTEALLQHWQFPEENTEAAAHHHDIPTYVKLDIVPLLACAEACSDFLLEPAPATHRFFEKKYQKLRLGTEMPLEDFLRSVVEGARAIGDILDVPFPNGIDVQQMLHQVVAMEEAAKKQEGK